MYKTTCPDCGAEGQLELCDGTFQFTGMKLRSNGISLKGVKKFYLEKGGVKCTACRNVFELYELELG